jgi:PAS domain S-box-containing protein
MSENSKGAFLLTEEQPAQLLSYEAILSNLREELKQVNSGGEALQRLLKLDTTATLMEQFRCEVEWLVAARTAALEASLAQLRESEARYRGLVQPLPAAIYTCDAQGRVTLYNEAAVALWGREPEVGKDLWCGSWRIYKPDGTPLPLDACPMAVAIREGRPVRGQEIIIERPDGTRAYILPFPDPIRDASGAVIGAVNMLVDLTERRQAEERMVRLQAVAAALSAALTPSQVCEVIVQEATSTLEAKAGALYIVSKDGQWLELARLADDAEEETEVEPRLPLTAPFPAAEAARTGEALWLETEVSLPLWFERRALGSLNFSFAKARGLDPEEREFLLTLARLCTQALERARLYEVEQQARIEAEANQQRLALLAEMRERNRLAQELHDTVAQALGYLNLKIGMTYSSLNSGEVETAKANLQELKQVIGETYTDVREEIFYLRAKALSELSFMELLEKYTDKYRRFYNLDIQVIQEAEAGLFDFSAEVTTQLVRTIQEALINVRKHAHVNKIIIRLGQEADVIRISIEDQGQGFDLDQIKEKRASFGLQMMRERVESVGGSLEVETAPGQGTRVVLRYRKA